MGIFNRNLDQLAARGDLKGLFKVLMSVDPVKRQQAALVLGTCGREAVPYLIEALKGDDKEVRTVAAGALISIGPEARSAVGTLIRALKDEYYFVRWNAAAALGEIGDKAAAPYLAKLLQDENDEVRKTASSSLKMLGWDD
jgi:HEAT repeat protein